jgi:hypothetical protein
MDTKKIIREILSEPTGTLSWGRIASTTALVAAIAWVTRLVLTTHAMPDLTGISTFVVAPYGANKVATAVQSFSNNPVGGNKTEGK